MNLTWSKISEDTFSHDAAHSILSLCRRLVAVPAESDHWWLPEETKDSDIYSDTDDNGSAVKRDREQNGGTILVEP